MAKENDPNVDENAVTDTDDHVDADETDAVDPDDVDGPIDEDSDDPDAVIDPDEDGDEEEDETDQALIEAAAKYGITEAQANAMGWAGVSAVAAAQGQQRSDAKVPEDDPFELKLTEDEIADLPPAMARELGRIAKAAKDGIASTKEEIAPLKAEIAVFRQRAQREYEEKGFRAFHSWCDNQKDDALGTSEKPKHKMRKKLYEEAVKVASGAPTLSVEDVCEVAYKKVLKTNPKQKANKALQKAAEKATRQADAGVGRGASVRRASSNGRTQAAAVDRVRLLLRGSG
jgi:hypothetical protein